RPGRAHGSRRPARKTSVWPPHLGRARRFRGSHGASLVSSLSGAHLWRRRARRPGEERIPGGSKCARSSRSGAAGGTGGTCGFHQREIAGSALKSVVNHELAAIAAEGGTTTAKDR